MRDDRAPPVDGHGLKVSVSFRPRPSPNPNRRLSKLIPALLLSAWSWFISSIHGKRIECCASSAIKRLHGSAIQAQSKQECVAQRTAYGLGLRRLGLICCGPKKGRSKDAEVRFKTAPPEGQRRGHFEAAAGRPVVGSKPFAFAISAIRSSAGNGGGTLALCSSSHLKLPFQTGSGAGGKGAISSSSGTLAFR